MIVYINIGNSKGLLVTFIQNHCILSLFSILSLFLDRQLAITIYSKASQKEFCMFCFSLRTKVYKMRFDSSTLYSISDVVPSGEASTAQRQATLVLLHSVQRRCQGRTHGTVETGARGEHDKPQH